MKDVNVLHERFRKGFDNKYVDRTKDSAFEELALLCECGFENVRTWYYRNNDIPAKYVLMFSEFFDVDVLYLLGLQDEERRKETDTAEYLRMKESSINVISHLTDRQRDTLEKLLENRTEFTALLDNVSECFELHDKINDEVDRIEHTAPGNRYNVTYTETVTQETLDDDNNLRQWLSEKLNRPLSPSRLQIGEQKRTIINERMTEEDAAYLLRYELQRLEAMLNQQRPIRMDIYDKLIDIIDGISPRIDRPADLLADAEKIVSQFPEAAAMQDSGWAGLANDLRHKNIRVNVD